MLSIFNVIYSFKYYIKAKIMLKVLWEYSLLINLGK